MERRENFASLVQGVLFVTEGGQSHGLSRAGGSSHRPMYLYLAYPQKLAKATIRAAMATLANTAAAALLEAITASNNCVQSARAKA